MEFPLFNKVEQKFCCDHIANVEETLKKQLHEKGIPIFPGASVAITAGSRGIANIQKIIKTVVDWVREQGGAPFIVPAMGSHGNGDAEEQKKILTGLGITEESVGAPIRATMEVVELPKGDLSTHVYMDRYAAQADATIVINRIKVHGDFSGETESGLLKMCTIGLGKHKQALEIHRQDIKNLRQLIVKTARQMIAHGNLIMGVGIVENAYHETMELQVLRPEEFEIEEKKMLRHYKEIMPKFPLDEFDILIVDEIGKEISGAGMETKIVGRLRSGAEEPAVPRIRFIVTTDLTKASHGNACGVGLADFITKRLFDKIDLAATNENIVTCRCIEQGRIPIIAKDDREALEFAVRALGELRPDGPRMIRIKNTLQMNVLYVTKNVIDIVRDSPFVSNIGSKDVKLFHGEEREMIRFEELEHSI